MKGLIRLVLYFPLVSLLAAQEIDPSTVIERARATVGVEKALVGLTTLRVAAELQPADPTIPPALISITARKPCSQRMEIKIDDLTETTIVSGAHGCMIRSNLVAKASQMRDIIGPELSRLRYNTRQFFNFFQPDVKNGETVRYSGVESRLGLRVYKLNYAYPEGLTTIRYFSVKDGSLVSTISPNGVESVGVGSQEIAGIKFPKEVDYYGKGEKIHTIILKKIYVNKPLNAGIFKIPAGEDAI